MNTHAVSLGSLGGRRGGPARAASLSAERRSEIARKASRKRWSREHRIHLLRSSRLFRRRVARRLSTRTGLDAGDLEHALYNLTLSPMRRLARGLGRRIGS